MKEILENVHLLSLGGVNAYLIDHGALTLIDTGYAGNEQKILGYIKKIGRQPADLKNIIATHLHTDHTGSLARLKALTNAKVYMHVEDALLVEEGISFRDQIEVTPGFFNKLIFHLFIKRAPRAIESVKVDHPIQAGEDYLPIGKGFQVISVPGHAKGQVALLYQAHGGILFAADTSGNMMGVGPAPFYEDYQAGLRDIHTLSQLTFETIVFGHGNPVIGAADEKFRKRFKKHLGAVIDNQVLN